MIGSVLLHGSHLSGDKIGRHIFGRRGCGSVEGEHAEVVQVANDGVLLQRSLSAEVQRMPALCHAEDITQPIEVRGADRSSQCTTGVEVSGDRKLWQSL